MHPTPATTTTPTTTARTTTAADGAERAGASAGPFQPTGAPGDEGQAPGPPGGDPPTGAASGALVGGCQAGGASGGGVATVTPGLGPGGANDEDQVAGAFDQGGEDEGIWLAGAMLGERETPSTRQTRSTETRE